MMKKRQVVVTGLGCVSSYGRGVAPFWEGLLSGASNARIISQFDAGVYRSGIAAEVPQHIYDSEELRRQCAHPQEDSALLASLAVLEAMQDAGLDKDDIASKPAEFGCVLGSLCGGGRSFEAYGRTFLEREQDRQAGFPSPRTAHIDYQLTHVLSLLGATGPSTLVSTACSSATDAIGYAGDIIRSGDASIMLAGGADILAEIVHAGFNGVLSITKTHPKPFSEGRDGFFIGEGAAILVLEERSSALQRGAKIYAELCGYGLSNTAFHLTATSDSGKGEALSIQRALQDSQLQADDIDYVNAHGTSTQHNDQTELLALEQVFSPNTGRVKVNTIKPMIGHCMGAAGAMEAVATVLSIHHQKIPPTLNAAPDREKIKFDLVVNTPREAKIRHAISQSFGFGGACSSIVFGQV